MLIGHLGDDIKILPLMEVVVQEGFNWRQKKSTLSRLQNEKIISTEWLILLCANKVAEISREHATKGADKIYEGRQSRQQASKMV
jgi:hypothetical protein